jgi:hypothetical protein
MFTPVFGGALTERTEIRVAYDDKFIYVGGMMFDSEARKIRTNTLYRDRYSGDDIIAIVLDSYNDHQTASWFTVNPAGTRIDRAVSNDAEFSNGDPMNDNWNTFWDVATYQDETGWYAEMRIPFSSLGISGRQRPGHHGDDRLPPGGPEERTATLPRDSPELGPGLRQAIAGPAHRARRSPQQAPHLPHAVWTQWGILAGDAGFLPGAPVPESEGRNRRSGP